MAETDAPEAAIPNPCRTCRECQQSTPPDDVEFTIGSGIQVICWRCASSWPDAPAVLLARRAAEDELVQATAEIRDAPVAGDCGDCGDCGDGGTYAGEV